MTSCWMILNTRTNEPVSVGGHIFHRTTDPLTEFMDSGSEWITPAELRIVGVTVDYTFEPYSPVLPVPVEETDLGDL